jgi:hypothetical protein
MCIVLGDKIVFRLCDDIDSQAMYKCQDKIFHTELVNVCYYTCDTDDCNRAATNNGDVCLYVMIITVLLHVLKQCV